MKKNSKIYVAGHRGLVGSAIVRNLLKAGYTNLVLKTHEELDLTDQQETFKFFREEKPEYVFLSAAQVGGIHANSTYPASFIYNNLQIQCNVFEASRLVEVDKLLFLGSSCIYPKMSEQPIKEKYLLSGPLESSNQAYAIAKIAGIISCGSYNKQYGTDFISCMPTNLYGINDNYHPENSHVLSAMIRRFHEAKVHGSSFVTVWGTGTPKREFLFSEDLADACIFLMDNYTSSDTINVGSGQEVSIMKLASKVKETVGYKGAIEFDSTKLDGTPRKLLDSSRINDLGWKASTTLKEGLKIAYKDFLKSY